MSFLKITKKNYIYFSTNLFLSLSLVFLYGNFVKYKNASLFSLVELRNFAFTHYFPIFLTLFCYFATSKFSRHSGKLILLNVSIISLFTFSYFDFDSLDKILLLCVFLYMMIAFYFYQLWEEEVNLSCHNPNYTPNDIDNSVLVDITCQVNDQSGLLKNWDDISCFIQFPMPVQFFGEVLIEVKIDDTIFPIRAKVVSRTIDQKGYGLIIRENTSETRFNWSNFQELLHDRNIIPGLLK